MILIVTCSFYDAERLRIKHQQELENLTLTSQPFKTLKLFILAVTRYLSRSVAYLLSHRGWLMLLSTIVAIAGVLLVTVDGPHEKHVEEVLRYVRFGLWWVALGVASSIGLGSGLHTFVLYLGPHIALFTIKAVQCGRVDIKSALYDTIQLKRVPSWLGKDCAEFGPPLFPSSHGVRVPLSSILPQVQLEAILWGLGTALGELPPYFISRAVPNPLFDLAGIMCGQFGIPFWEFFLATMIGKAIIKTHIQGNKWEFSLAFIWNTIVWFMLMNFFIKIVNATAQRYLKKQQDKEIAALKNKSSRQSDDSDTSSRGGQWFYSWGQSKEDIVNILNMKFELFFGIEYKSMKQGELYHISGHDLSHADGMLA
ncbi:Vacuole membrane protein KMS1 [Sesamum angolense]|uniref:Vacuole membrane protein KMS1 n=1 Tax=Sesamum angolense TaxID=2727404 RepID=A0AAE2BKB4_9LAMI|nr:Vacuole membrane protein KMS1 [Sesamum angolense]